MDELSFSDSDHSGSYTKSAARQWVQATVAQQSAYNEFVYNDDLETKLARRNLEVECAREVARLDEARPKSICLSEKSRVKAEHALRRELDTLQQENKARLARLNGLVTTDHGQQRVNSETEWLAHRTASPEFRKRTLFDEIDGLKQAQLDMEHTYLTECEVTHSLESMKLREEASFIQTKQSYLTIKEEHRRVTLETNEHVVARQKAVNILNQAVSDIATEKDELQIKLENSEFRLNNLSEELGQHEQELTAAIQAVAELQSANKRKRKHREHYLAAIEHKKLQVVKDQQEEEEVAFIDPLLALFRFVADELAYRIPPFRAPTPEFISAITTELAKEAKTETERKRDIYHHNKTISALHAERTELLHILTPLQELSNDAHERQARLLTRLADAKVYSGEDVQSFIALRIALERRLLEMKPLDFTWMQFAFDHYMSLVTFFDKLVKLVEFCSKTCEETPAELVTDLALSKSALKAMRIGFLSKPRTFKRKQPRAATRPAAAMVSKRDAFRRGVTREWAFQNIDLKFEDFAPYTTSQLKAIIRESVPGMAERSAQELATRIQKIPFLQHFLTAQDIQAFAMDRGDCAADQFDELFLSASRHYSNRFEGLVNGFIDLALSLQKTTQILFSQNAAVKLSSTQRRQFTSHMSESGMTEMSKQLIAIMMKDVKSLSPKSADVPTLLVDEPVSAPPIMDTCKIDLAAFAPKHQSVRTIRTATGRTNRKTVASTSSSDDDDWIQTEREMLRTTNSNFAESEKRKIQLSYCTPRKPSARMQLQEAVSPKSARQKRVLKEVIRNKTELGKIHRMELTAELNAVKNRRFGKTARLSISSPKSRPQTARP